MQHLDILRGPNAGSGGADMIPTPEMAQNVAAWIISTRLLAETDLDFHKPDERSSIE